MDVSARRRAARDAHEEGDLAAAERGYRAILDEVPEDAETWHLLGVLRGQQERPADVVECCRRAIEHGYRTASVYANLGLAQRALGAADDAQAALRESLQLDPGDPDLTLDYADLLREAGKEAAALDVLRDASARFFNDVRVHTELGRLAAAVNDAKLATSAFERALALHQDSPAVWVNAGNLRQMLGDDSGAADAYRRALALDASLDLAYWHLVQLDAARRDTALTDTIVSRAAAAGSEASPQILFAAGKVQHEAGHTEKAFSAYAAGNRRVRQAYIYDVETDVEAMARLGSRLGEFVPTAEPDENGKQPLPLFIVGMPRSGSTLIERMLAGHSQIAAGGEILWLQRHLQRGLARSGLRYPEEQGELDDAELAELRRRYLDSLLLRSKGKPVVTDKLPGNFLCIPSIRRLFPESLVIHSRRDAVETCWSCYRHLFTGVQRFAYDLGELGRYCRAAQGLLDACRDRWPDHVVELRYEALIADPAAAIRPVVERTGLAWDSRCAEPASGRDVVMTASATQVRSGLAAAPMSSAGRYREYLGELYRALGAESP